MRTSMGWLLSEARQALQEALRSEKDKLVREQIDVLLRESFGGKPDPEPESGPESKKPDI